MATLVAKLEPFDETDGNWELYKERLELYFVANEVADAKKVAVTLSLVGGKTYALLHSLCAPALPSTKTFAELGTLLQEHLCPKPNVIAERYRFYKRQQQVGETVTEYLAAIQKLSEHCDFGEKLTEHLRDQLVCGIRSETTLKRLLSEKDLTFKKAKDTAIAMEMAVKDVTEIQGKAAASVNKVSTDKCFRCGRSNHTSDECKFKDEVCHNCGEKGHIRRRCKVKKPEKKKNDRKDRKPKFKRKFKKKLHAIVDDENTTDEGSEYEYTSESSDLNFAEVYCDLNSTRKFKSDAIKVKPTVNGKCIEMELDTGSALSIISQKDCDKMFGKLRLKESNVILRTYTGECVKPEGYAKVTVQINGQTARLPLYVLKRGGPPLFGREWLNSIKLDWKEIKAVKVTPRNKKLDKLLDEYKDLFDSKLGEMKGITAHLNLKTGATPKFFKPRQVPFALKDKVNKELDNMVEKGILSPVEWSEWAAPIVSIPKKDNTVRICGDFKVTVNPQLNVDQYPLPTIESMLGTLAGGKKFTKLDLKTAYLQMVVDEESRKYLTINTPKGLMQFNRLAYGIAPAASLWQRAMEQVLKGINNIQVILDDMIITGDTDESHLETLEKVFQRLQQYGLRLHPDKCEFFKDSVEFCAHKIDKDGIHKTDSKIKAVIKAPTPKNVSEVRSWVALVNYYHRFLPSLSTVLFPLHQLLHKGRKWQWTSECENAFIKTKELITSDLVLAHYDPKLPIRLHCDASSKGISGVISHVYPDGTERPISFASRTLSKSEVNYAQVDREALSIIWSVKKFNMYLFARKFTLVTDCKVLTSIFHPQKGIPTTTASRMQRYAVFLSGYEYDIEYRKTKDHANADGLSRLPLPYKPRSTSEEKLFYSALSDVLPITYKQIAIATRKDRVLSRVLEFTKNGWPTSVEPDLAPYKIHDSELSISQECLLFGNRVIIPENFQAQFLDELHLGHAGIVKIKQLARSYVWWPGIDSDIETKCKFCQPCVDVGKQPAKATVHPWEWPNKPWSRLHLDFAGPFLGHMFLIVVDSHSRWPEVKIMDKITADETIKVLQEMFSSYGICDVICTDNGSTFISESFQKFLKLHGIVHKLTSPAKPSRNGLAERCVQNLKQSLKAMKNEPYSVHEKVAKFLLMYRTTKNQTTNETPSLLFLGRELKTRLNLAKPNLSDIVNRNVNTKDEIQRRNFQVGEEVMVRDYRVKHEKWIYGVITKKTGTLMYEIEVNGTIWRRHVDQIRSNPHPLPSKVSVQSDNTTGIIPQPLPIPVIMDKPTPSVVTRKETPKTVVSARKTVKITSPVQPETSIKQEAPSCTPVSRPRRTIKRPKRYED